MNHPSANKITKLNAQHVLHFFDHGGVQPGCFTTALLETLARADSENFARLANSFPGECAAWKLTTKSVNGIEVLQAIAEEKLATVTVLHEVRA
jgi:hypothetical protein